MRDSKHYGVTSFGISSEGEGTVPCPVVRKFISPAVYVESSAKRMALKLSDSSSQHFFKVKKCVCSTEAEICVCHPEKPPQKATAVKVSPLSSKSSIKTDSGYSGSAGANLDREDLRLSLTSLTANSSINNCDEDIRRKVYQDWLVKKKKEELLRQLQEEKIQKEKELERLKKLEQERESFRKWLLSKKKEEEKKKLVKWRKEEEEKILTARSKVDPEENEMRFRAWLKRKEKEKLEKQLKEKEDELRTAEEKQRRLEDSAIAYQEWLRSSKYKPKPLPLSRGIETLRASASVSYVNPTPWVPNIEQK